MQKNVLNIKKKYHKKIVLSVVDGHKVHKENYRYVLSISNLKI